MKTYREMTESVLHKAGTEVLKRERRRRNAVCIAAAGLCFMLLVTVLGMGMGQAPIVLPTQPGEQPGISMDATNATQLFETQATAKIKYLSNTESVITEQLLPPDVSIPLNGMIWVRDIRELTKEEVDQVRQEVNATISEFHWDGDGRFTKWEYPGAIVASATNGVILLDFSNSPTVKNIDCETTDMGSAPRVDVVDGYRVETSFHWSISCELADAFHHDPTIPLESIRDTVKITVQYENETKDVFIFDITVNEEGQIFVTQRGIPTEAA